MTRDKKVLYTLAAATTTGLLATVLFNRGSCIPIAAVFLTVTAVAVCLLVKKRRAPSLNHKTVLLLAVVFGLLYFTVYYLSGLRFGFVKPTVPFNLQTLIRRILPAAAIVVASELIRRVLLSQERRVAATLAFVIGLLSELALAGGLWGITYFNALMDMLGLTLFPAISAGLLCQFISARHGALPCVVYRLLIALVPFFIPVTPNLPDALKAFVTLLHPLLLLFFLRVLFEKRVRRATASPHAKRLGLVSVIAGLVLATGLMALVSCQFRYGTIVIATGSMTGDLNVGDTIIYERYKGQSIQEGDIVVFQRDRSLIVHRVVEITHINGQTRYFTKGDANENRDVGFIVSNDIVGITDFKISYIGYPSLWMHRIFELGS
ncbi:MAG: signal peptidase I [Ruminococcaceae bacterium]|nr:signal peptidase I [Oscillospiraceae bacterium]